MNNLKKIKYKGYVHIVHFESDIFWIISRINQPEILRVGFRTKYHANHLVIEVVFSFKMKQRYQTINSRLKNETKS